MGIEKQRAEIQDVIERMRLNMMKARDGAGFLAGAAVGALDRVRLLENALETLIAIAKRAADPTSGEISRELLRKEIENAARVLQ